MLLTTRCLSQRRSNRGHGQRAWPLLKIPQAKTTTALGATCKFSRDLKSPCPHQPHSPPPSMGPLRARHHGNLPAFSKPALSFVLLPGPSWPLGTLQDASRWFSPGLCAHYPSRSRENTSPKPHLPHCCKCQQGSAQTRAKCTCSRMGTITGLRPETQLLCPHPHDVMLSDQLSPCSARSSDTTVTQLSFFF